MAGKQKTARSDRAGFRGLQLKGKLVLFSGISLLCTIAIVTFIAYSALTDAYNQAIENKRNSFDIEIKSAVESVISALNSNFDSYVNGTLTNEQAEEISKNIIRTATYGNGSGYFWADKADGTCVVHQDSSIEGTNRLNVQDKEGNYYIKNLIAAGDSSKSGGFTEFYYTKPGNNSGTFHKRAFTMKFDLYGWYISTGIYYDEMDAAINQQLAAKTHSIVVLLLSSLIVAVLGMVLMLLFASRISKPIERVTHRLQLLASGDVHTPPVPVVATQDEMGRLTKATDIVIREMRDIIGDITSQLQYMAAGDMTSTASAGYIGDFAPIRESLINIQNSLGRTISAIDSSANQVSSGATQISSAAQGLASSTSEQAATMEELFASVSRVSDTSHENAKNTSLATQNVEATVSSLGEANLKMDEMLTAMGDIDSSSEKIGEIIQLIENIAFQTNILALNAAIEAARAGAAGSGFAVVADEVRNLSQKTSEAAKQTRKLVLTSIQSVNSGTQLADTIAKKFHGCVDEMNSLRAAILEIQEASKAQADAISQITGGLSQISSVVQSNAASAEESSAFSEELSAQAAVLYEEMSRFRVREKEISVSHTAPRPPVAAPAIPQTPPQAPVSAVSGWQPPVGMQASVFPVEQQPAFVEQQSAAPLQRQPGPGIFSRLASFFSGLKQGTSQLKKYVNAPKASIQAPAVSEEPTAPAPSDEQAGAYTPEAAAAPEDGSPFQEAAAAFAPGEASEKASCPSDDAAAQDESDQK